jgi:hypothetical protein
MPDVYCAVLFKLDSCHPPFFKPFDNSVLWVNAAYEAFVGVADFFHMNTPLIVIFSVIVGLL